MLKTQSTVNACRIYNYKVVDDWRLILSYEIPTLEDLKLYCDICTTSLQTWHRTTADCCVWSSINVTEPTKQLVSRCECMWTAGIAWPQIWTWRKHQGSVSVCLQQNLNQNFPTEKRNNITYSVYNTWTQLLTGCRSIPHYSRCY